eukprot:1034538-Heterocapsa_arctica.AAC.1
MSAWRPGRIRLIGFQKIIRSAMSSSSGADLPYLYVDALLSSPDSHPLLPLLLEAGANLTYL